MPSKMTVASYFWISITVWTVIYHETALSCKEIVSGKKGEIKTPNYPRNYDDNLDCTWTIQAEDDETVIIEFRDFHVETSLLPLKECADTFRVYDGPDRSSTQLLDQNCGDTTPEPLYSSGNVLTLVLTTDEKTQKKGVFLKWRVSDKFTVHLDVKTWEEANAHCTSEGGHMTTINKLNEPLILKQLHGNSGSLWIGEYFTPWIWLKGCYKDEDLKLISSKRFTQTKENEAKICQYICRDAVYFGLLEFDCFCLTSEEMDALTFSRPNTECKIKCPGNDKELCGGAFALTVYMNDICWKNSSTWTAKISKTISGRRCQSWASNSPHAHTFHGGYLFPDGTEALASNYCRDPDGRGAPWCFTEDPDVPWQFCDAPPCIGTCWNDPVTYTGNLNVSLHGHSCRYWANDLPPYNWAFHDPSKFPDTSVAGASNYCRSPDSSPSLWCYLESADGWNYCGSPPCFGTTQYEDTGELCRLYWANDNKFYVKEHNCDGNEHYSCFVGEEEDSAIPFVPEEEDSTTVRFLTADFSTARSFCRLQYSLSNYKTLFGRVTHSNMLNREYWLGNFRGEDDTGNKDGVPTPSACKTVRKTSKGLTTDFQPDCQLPLGYICQTDAVLCGAKFYNDSGNISSPGYPDKYEDNDFCIWEINVSEGRAVEIVFHDVDIEQSNNCSFDYIEVFEAHTNPSKSIGKLCGNVSNVSIISASNQLLIKFKTDKEATRKGFYMEWTSELIPTSPYIPTSTISTTNKMSSSTNGNLARVTEKFVEETPETEERTLGAGALAGIVIGVLLAVSITVILVILFLRSRRGLKTQNQDIFELQQRSETVKTTSNSEPPQPDVYSTPTPKGLQQPQIPGSAPNSDDSYYHHLHQTTNNKASQLGSRNPYERLHRPDMYDHTSDSKGLQTGETYDHVESDRNDSLNKDDKTTHPDSMNTDQRPHAPDMYDRTTTESIDHKTGETYDHVKSDRIDSIHEEDSKNLEKLYMAMTATNQSEERSTKATHNTDNYLTPIGGQMNSGIVIDSPADIKDKNRNEVDSYNARTEDGIEDDTYYNVSEDKTAEQTAESDQSLYEIEDAGSGIIYDNLNN